MCMNETDENGYSYDLELFGSNEMSRNSALHLVYRPCVPEQITNSNRDQSETKCLANLDS